MGRVLLQKFNKVTVSVPQIPKFPRPGGTYFHAGRSKILLKPVITQSTLIGNFFYRMNEPATIRACLYAIPASDTIFFINKYDPLRA